MNDLARFARPTFDPLAFLLEHVCDPTQVPIISGRATSGRPLPS